VPYDLRLGTLTAQLARSLSYGRFALPVDNIPKRKRSLSFHGPIRGNSSTGVPENLRIEGKSASVPFTDPCHSQA
jgi:hypothetical protein